MNKDQRKQFLSSMLKTNQNNNFKQPLGRKQQQGQPNQQLMGNMPMNNMMKPGGMLPMGMPNQQMMNQMRMPNQPMMGNKLPMGGMQGMNMPMGGMQGMNMPMGMHPGMTNMNQMPNVKNLPNNNLPNNNNPINRNPNQNLMQNNNQQKPQQNQNNNQQDWNNKKASFNKKHYDSLSSQQEKCQYLGEIFWPYVAMKDPELKRKITGFMIWNFDHNELINAIHDEKKLEEIFNKSRKTVQQSGGSK